VNAFPLIGLFERADGRFGGLFDFGLVGYAVVMAKADPEGAHDGETGGDDPDGRLDGRPHTGVDKFPCEMH
jgi:hypothetical protein